MDCTPPRPQLRGLLPHSTSSSPSPHHNNPNNNNNNNNNNTSSSDIRSGGGSDGSYYNQWASPTEVLQMRAMCNDLVSTYQGQLNTCAKELAQVKAERDVYLAEIRRTEEVKKKYMEGKKVYEVTSEAQQRWREEKALLTVRLQSLTVENEKLQLVLDKQRAARGVVVSGGNISVINGGKPTATIHGGHHHHQQHHQHQHNVTTTAETPRSQGGATNPNQHIHHSSSHAQRDVSPSTVLSTEFSPLQPLSPATTSAMHIPAMAAASAAPPPPPPPAACLDRTAPPVGGSSSLPTPSSSTNSNGNNNNNNVSPVEGGDLMNNNNNNGPSERITTPSPYSTYADAANARRDSRTMSTNNQSTSHNNYTPTNSAGGGSTTVSSIPILYHVPRSPAEALETEGKLLASIQQLTHENNTLLGQLKTNEVMYETTRSRREHKAAQFAQENEALRNRLHAALEENHRLSCELKSATANWHEVRDALGEVQERYLTLESEHRLTADTNSEKLLEACGELRRQHDEEKAILRRECTAAVALADSARLFLKKEMDSYAKKTQAESRAALQASQALEADVASLRRTLRATENDLADQKRAHEAEVQHLCDKLKAETDANCLLRIARDEAVATVSNLQADALTHGEMLKNQMEANETMEARLAQACASLSAMAEVTAERDALLLRVDDLQEQLETAVAQRTSQVKTLHTALQTLQAEHAEVLERQAARYEKLSVRFAKSQLRLEAAAKGEWDKQNADHNNKNSNHRGGKKAKAEQPRTTTHHGRAAADGDEVDPSIHGSSQHAEEGAAAAAAAAGERGQDLVCDPRAILTDSMIAVARIGSTINHKIA